MKNKKEKNKIEEVMENLEQPNIQVNHHQEEFRLTLMNTKKSALLGAVFMILPLLFFSGVILKHYLQLDFGILTSVYDWIAYMDHLYGDYSFINWGIRFLLLFGPIIAIGLNLLAVFHIRYEKTQQEIVMSIKLKCLNWLIILLSSSIFLVFFLYMIVENMR